MKRILTILTAVFALCISTSAQDIMTKKDGTDIHVKVLEVNPNDVRYVLFEEQDGPVYTIRKNEVMMIRYASGRNEVFQNGSPYHNMYGTSGYVPMKYKQLKTMYDYKAYNPTPYDRYSPAWSGVASFFIPGLGQMVCGETGRGFAWLGATFGCYMVTSLGTSLIVGGAYNDYYTDSGDHYVEENTGNVVVGLLMAYVGAIGAMSVDIASIVDAVRVAKVKNMYEQDMRSQYSFDVNLYPSVNCVRTPTGVQPTAGLTLAMRF